MKKELAIKQIFDDFVSKTFLNDNEKDILVRYIKNDSIANPLGLYEDDCVIRAISCALNKSWDSVYDELSDLAQAKGTLLDKKDFVRGYLDSHFRRIDSPPYKVYQVAQNFKNNIVLCTMKGHIVCIKYGRILDTFNPSDRVVEDVWIVK